MEEVIKIPGKPENRDLCLLDKVKKRIADRPTQFKKIKEEIVRLEALIAEKNACFAKETNHLQKWLDEVKSIASKRNRYLPDRKIMVSVDENLKIWPSREVLFEAAKMIVGRLGRSGNILFEHLRESFVYDRKSGEYQYLPYRVQSLREVFLDFDFSGYELIQAGVITEAGLEDLLIVDQGKSSDVKRVKDDIQKIRLKYSHQRESDEIARLKKNLENLSTISLKNHLAFDGQNLPKLSTEVERIAIKEYINRKVTEALTRGNFELIEKDNDVDLETEFWQTFFDESGKAKDRADKIAKQFPVKQNWWHNIKGLFGVETVTLEKFLNGIEVNKSVESYIDLNKWIFRLRKAAKLLMTSPDQKAKENGIFYLELANELQQMYVSLPYELEMSLNDDLFDFDELSGVIGVLPEILRNSRLLEVKKRIEIAAEVHDESADLEVRLNSNSPANDSQTDPVQTRLVS